MKMNIHVGIIGFSLHEQEQFGRIFATSLERERCYILKELAQNEPVDLLIVKTATESALKKLHFYAASHRKVPIVAAGRSEVAGFEYHIQGVLLVSRVLKVLDAVPVTPKTAAEHAQNVQTIAGTSNVPIGGQYDILVVNNNQQMCQILENVLRKSDIPLNIDFAMNETLAIAKIKQKYYDFLFVDANISNFAEIDNSISATRKEGVRSSVVMPIAEESAVDDAHIVLRVLKAFEVADDLADAEVPYLYETEDSYAVLVVDDSELMHKALKMELDKSEVPLRTTFAFSGEEALEKIAQQPYDFIFLDVMMSGIDGFETCSRIRKIKSMGKVPVIMLTAKSSPLDEVKGIVAGCNTYLAKPIKPEEFQKMLARIMRWLRDFKREF
jgi:CheY-like chemotaxis protein